MHCSDFCLQEDSLSIVPVCHYRMEFAWCVRRAFFEIRPHHVAVELPSTLSSHIIRAVERFPYLSAICYQNAAGDLVYFPVEPTDGACEAVRLTLEHKIPFSAIDLDLDDYPLHFDPMPDSYALYRLGLSRYWEAFENSQRMGARPPLTEADELRETSMAWHLQRIMEPGKKVLLICGMTHVRGILSKLRRPQVQPLGRVVRSNIRIFNLHADSIREVTSEMPFLISVYEMERGGHKVPPPEAKEIGQVISLDGRRKAPPETPGPLSVKEQLRPVEPEELPRPAAGAGGQDAVKKGLMKELMKALARKLNLMPDHFLMPGGELWDESPGALTSPRKIEIKRENVFRFKTSEDRCNELLGLYKALSEEHWKEGSAVPLWDRQRLLLALVRKAARFYKENTGEEIKQWQIRTMAKYARNYALVSGMLIADFYQLIMAARGVADDNFAYEVWDLGSYYPWIDRNSPYETARITAEEMWLGAKKFTIRRRYPRLRERLVEVPVKRRKKEEKPGEWTKNFNDMHMCSYPPEDLIIEGYGTYLKKKALAILSEEKARVEPFTNSLLDGIDVRETIRNWHHEKKIFVREFRRGGGGAGSVVVIYDEDREDRRFPWKMTWLGEHNQESDMAFYATPLTAKIVGPGIARCEYGGFMLTSPPLRLYDVWTDPFYREARKKSEVLLMAAIEYSVERHVVYVAAEPPRSWFRTFASRLDRKIVYIPIGQLSPVSLKKLRVFHVLSGRQVRKIAKDYVW
ncbi:MAG: hypothetical protein RDV48_30405 [Candidatus Eremiobacteraeota bacterium]|nr:hypothetical protein [Candidatus Eremiobacteraeota bacterium]